MTTVLLTGGLGYIGSHIAVELLNSQDKYNVIIIDNFLNSSYDSLNIINQNIKNSNNTLEFYQVDMVKNKRKLETIFEENKIDIVIHLAGLKSVGESVKNPNLYYSNNLISTINLIDIMGHYNCKNLIFSSSATVYGSLDAPYAEDMVVGKGLSNPYGKTKYMQEEMLKDLYHSDNSWNIIILRYFNPISQKNMTLAEKPNGIPNNIFPYIVKVHKKELQELQVFGNDYNTPDGTCVRDFIHVVDLANGHIKACEYIINNKNIELKIFNLGTGNGVSVQQLLDTFEYVNKTKINYRYVERRPGDLPLSYADCSLANKDLGWSTKYNISDMVNLK